jgi:hypothetical protein
MDPWSNLSTLKEIADRSDFPLLWLHRLLVGAVSDSDLSVDHLNTLLCIYPEFSSTAFC